MYHYRKTIKSYSKLNAKDKTTTVCTFCREDNLDSALEVSDTMMVIKNRVSYDIFEGRRVVDHLMIVPLRHVERFDEFNHQEKVDFMEFVGRYEADCYNLYARGVGSTSRSVKHQHTHLIKLVDKPAKLILYAKKPYVVIDI